MNFKNAVSWAVFLCAAGLAPVAALDFNAEQLQLIQNTAASICNTVKDAAGKKTDLAISGDVKAELNGLVGKVVNVGSTGKGSLSREEFEGLSRDATAEALKGDQGCRERVFNKMFDKLTSDLSSTSGGIGNSPSASSPDASDVRADCVLSGGTTALPKAGAIPVSASLNVVPRNGTLYCRIDLPPGFREQQGFTGDTNDTVWCSVAPDLNYLYRFHTFEVPWNSGPRKCGLTVIRLNARNDCVSPDAQVEQLELGAWQRLQNSRPNICH